ncbi:MAG: hypothetical protein QM764_13830 [Chitinophagaceae bacterium]
MPEEAQILAAIDYLIKNIPDAATKDAYVIMQNYYPELSVQGLTEIEKANLVANRYFFVIKEAEERGFIKHPNSSTQWYVLTDLAKKAKEKGGVKEYYEFLKITDNAVVQQITYGQRTVDATEKAAKAAEDSARYSKYSMILIAVYVLLTLGIFLIGIPQCIQACRQNNNTDKATPSKIDNPNNSPNDTSK